MTAFFSFILLIFFCVFVAVCVVAFRVYRSFRSMASKFNDFKSGSKRSSYSRGGQSAAADETIIDRRTPDEVNRKIFSKNEGEYVDFEEEKP